MSLEDVVEVTITNETKTPTKPGFGTPLIAASKVPVGWGSARVRVFSKLAELKDLGFATTDPAYKAASLIVSQNPRPKKFAIGKRLTAPAQSVKLKCISALQGDVYTVDVAVGNGAFTTLSYTVLAAATTTTVATAIELLTEAVVGVDSAAATDTITVTPNAAGTLVNFRNWSSNFEITDATPDPGLAADLDDFAEANVDWYGLCLDSNSKAEVVVGAAWTEANKKIFAYNTSDAAVRDPATTATNVFYVLKGLSYKRSVGLYSGTELLSYAGAAWLGRVFPYPPGKLTWAYKDLAGVATDKLETGHRAAIEAANGNHYEEVAGLAVTRYGKTASGEFADVTHFLDWLEMEMKIAVFVKIASGPKTPYTTNGINSILGVMRGVMRAGVRVGGLADDENLYVRGPAVTDVDASVRASRLLPNLEFGGRLAGAIHTAILAGTVSA